MSIEDLTSAMAAAIEGLQKIFSFKGLIIKAGYYLRKLFSDDR